MKQRRTDRMLLGCSVISFFIMSVSFLLMPVHLAAILPGILFWLGLIAGTAFQLILEARRRAFFKYYKIKRGKLQKPTIGLFSFGSNPAAIVADCSMLISLIAMVLAFVFTKGYGTICYVFIAAVLFSFCMHCVLNGRIYFHIDNQLKLRRMLVQKKANFLSEGEGKHD